MHLLAVCGAFRIGKSLRFSTTRLATTVRAKSGVPCNIVAANHRTARGVKMGTMIKRFMTFASSLLFIFLALSFVTKADSTTITWDFSFYSVSDVTDLPNGVVSGSGSFTTLSESYPVSPYAGELEIVSTSGEMNGEPMGYVDEPYNGISSSGEPFLNFLFYFTAGGNEYYIHDVDVDESPIYTGNTLYGPDGYEQLLDITLTQDPVSTPEGSSIGMLLLGLVGVGLFWKRARPGSIAAAGSI